MDEPRDRTAVRARPRPSFRRVGVACLLVASTLMLALPATPLVAAEIEPDADKILRAMTAHLSRLKAFTARYDVDNEIIDVDGQKLQFSSSGTLAVERPNKLRVTRKGAFAEAELVFDGSTISIVGRQANVYAQLPSPGSAIEEAVEELRAATGIDAPGADLLAADSYAVLTEDVVEGSHIGTGVVGGVECEHLAFRNPRVDWQIWIAKGDKPLPMKYVVTTKWITGAPQFTLRLADWNEAPQLGADRFVFTAPPGARKLETVHADAIGEIMPEATP